MSSKNHEESGYGLNLILISHVVLSLGSGVLVFKIEVFNALQMQFGPSNRNPNLMVNFAAR
jgi:hypothetical protein